MKLFRREAFIINELLIRNEDYTKYDNEEDEEEMEVVKTKVEEVNDSTDF